MGTVIFIGAGPGAADLITLRGARHLASADVVLHDALTDPALRDLAPRARWINVGKRGYRDSTGQTSINALLVRCANEVDRVVRLKGGDPSVFGRLEEELEALAAAHITCEVVPGVTAAIAAAAATQRPLTRRGSGRSVSLSTAVTAVASPRSASLSARAGAAGGVSDVPRSADGGRDSPHAQGSTVDSAPSVSEAPTRHDSPSSVRASRTADTEVFYMAGKQLGPLGRRLVGAGWSPLAPVSVVSRAGWPDQLHSDHSVATLAGASLLHAGRPTVVTVGAGAAPISAPAADRTGRSQPSATPLPTGSRAGNL